MTDDNIFKQFIFHIASDATSNGGDPESVNRVARLLNPDIPKDGMTVGDCNGDPLVKNGIYTLDGETVSIVGERYGCGNVIDTYYYVRYMNSKNQEQSILIEQNGGSLFDGWTYKSKFKPIWE